jgi:carboxymethylenebutenolidase
LSDLDHPIDPSAATSPALRRGAFVSIGAAAVAAATSSARAATQLGKPHAPLVSETDPAIVVFKPVMISANRQINSYAAVPNDAGPTTPGVVVTMAIWGVDAQLRDTVRRLAKAGYVAIAPDLYSSFGPPSGDGVSDADAFRPLAKKLVPETVASDLSTGAQWIRTRLPGDAAAKTKVGIMGFCMGGAIVLRQTVADAPPYDAASAFYGNIASLDPKAVKVPLMGSYGARDTSIPAAGVTEFYNAIPFPHELKIYPDAGHAFFDDTRQSYVPADAEDAWKRTMRWFNYYLKR